ncbi:hypothetical protein CXK86_00870 [Paenibacillus sp. BGI2013]|nr:hypothetical protein CXK86_00870 [Paenibacillus sp. BGI2013]
MAYCDYCRKGIGPNKNFEFIFHETGVFGLHDYCKEDMSIRLENISKGKSPGNNTRGTKDRN